MSYTDTDPEIVAAYVYVFGKRPEDADALEKAYRGRHDTMEQYAEEFYTDTHDIPDFLAGFIDWKKVGRDLERNGYAFHAGHVFYTH